MLTPHLEAKNGDFAKTVIMPGDPMRVKYIAENFLTDAILINNVRAEYGYTGYYKGKHISILSSGMGMPSMGIYCYELFKFYDVENIIRIGSCGAYSPDLKLFDIILSDRVFSESNFALTFNNDNCHISESSPILNSVIEESAKNLNIHLEKGNTISTDCFDLYMTDVNQFLSRVPDEFNPISAEMEAFSLFYTAKFLNKKASCLMSVVDSKHIKEVATQEEREKGLNKMIQIALDSVLYI